MREPERLRAGNLDAFDGADPFEGAALDIEEEFKRRLAGLQALRPAERMAARRAAKLWRAGALKALRGRQADRRRSRDRWRQLNENRPRP